MISTRPIAISVQNVHVLLLLERVQIVDVPVADHISPDTVE